MNPSYHQDRYRSEHADAQERRCHAVGVCQASEGGTCQSTCRRHAATARPAPGPALAASLRLAPGVIQGGASRKRRLRLRRRLAAGPLGRLVLQAMALLVFAAVLGHLAGVAQARGWPL